MDMRTGTDTALARVVAVFGAARPHRVYCFVNRRANRMKVLVHDDIGVWLAARRLHQGGFTWSGINDISQLSLSERNSTHSFTACRGSAWGTRASSASSDEGEQGKSEHQPTAFESLTTDTGSHARRHADDPAQLDGLNADELRALARELLERTGRDARAIVLRDAKIDKLTFEIAQLRRCITAPRVSS